MLGLPRRPREPPGGPRRPQEAAQEAPGNPLGCPRSRMRRREGAEVPQTTVFAWFGDVEVVFGRWDAENHVICAVFGCQGAENHVICVVFGCQDAEHHVIYVVFGH